MTDGSHDRLPIKTCPVCARPDKVRWITAASFELVRCVGCGHRYSSEIFNSNILSERYYSEDSRDFEARTSSAKVERFKEYTQMLKRVGINRGRVLDVGCNAGELLELFLKSGWSVAGVEVSPAPATFASQRLGAKIWQGPVEQVLPKSERFDLITFTHVLEHLLDPISVLKRLRTAIPGGILLVEVPNADDLLLNIWGGNYRPLCPGDHVSFFDEHSLRLLLETAGFEVREIQTPTHARDLIFAPLLSTIDYFRNDVLSRHSLPTTASPANATGVLEQTRYRGRFRRPLRSTFDQLASLLDPPIVRCAPFLFGKCGPVLIATARAIPE